MPSLTDAAYTNAFREVKELGAKDSTIRTQEQTDIGQFWAYDRLGMGTPLRMYNRVLRTIAEGQENSLAENARLFAMASTAMADAGVTAWDSKFLYNFWRPVTGIRAADSDGNPDTVADPLWEPLGAPGGVLEDGTVIPDFTPPFPTYVSGHASFGGALFESLAEFYETDDVAFEIRSEEMPAMVRGFDSFSAAMRENGRSRVYLGIHWNFDDLFARELGQGVARVVSASYFKPVPEPGMDCYFITAAIALGAFRRRRYQHR
jgi:membrane-associated phospholipid phosphatase